MMEKNIILQGKIILENEYRMINLQSGTLNDQKSKTTWKRSRQTCGVALWPLTVCISQACGSN
jgi:hypothetical protein